MTERDIPDDGPGRQPTDPTDGAPPPRDRGQSIVVGFILVVGIVVTLLTVYQTSLVPDANAAVERDHSRAVADEFVSLRSVVDEVAGSDRSGTWTLPLGVTYPGRPLAVNPNPADGRVRTEPVGAYRSNATDLARICAADARSVAVAYDPGYKEYRTAPTTVYETTVVYRNFSGNVSVEAGQTLLSNRTIDLAGLVGTYRDTGAEPTAPDVRGGRTYGRTVEATEPIRLTVPTRLPADRWRTDDDLLAGVPTVRRVSANASGGIDVVLEPGEYTLRCRTAGIERVPPPDGLVDPERVEAGRGGVSPFAVASRVELSTAGGRLRNVTNATGPTLLDPELVARTPNAGTVTTDRRYVRLGLTATEADGTRYDLLVGGSDGIAALTDGSGYENATVRIVRDDGTPTTIVDGRLTNASLDDWTAGDPLNLTDETNYRDPAAVESGLDEFHSALADDTPTRVTIADLHGRVTLALDG